mgnify:FL=1|jgi:hypothetical protein
MRRRTFFQGVSGIFVAGVAGCVATQEEFEFEADPGAFANEVVEDAGYEELDQQEVVVNRTVEAGGTERDVTVINYSTEYERSVDIAGQRRPLAAAVVFVTPSASVVGQEYNPIADESLTELARRANGRLGTRMAGGEIEDIEKLEERSMTVLDSGTSVGVFSGRTELGGTELSIRLLVTRVKHENDYVILGAAYPEQLAPEERSRVETLFSDVDHGDN